MKARFLIENTRDIEATMKITMTIGDWEKLRDQLASTWPASDLYTHISDLLGQAKKVFYSKEE